MFLSNICYNKAVFEWSNFWQDRLCPDSYLRLDFVWCDCGRLSYQSVKQGEQVENYRVVRSTVDRWSNTLVSECAENADGHASVWPGSILTQLCLAWSTWLLVNHHTDWNKTATARRGSSPWTVTLACQVSFTTTVMSLTPERCACTCNQLVSEFTVPHIWGAV